ncbi:MAG: galactose-1-phosphate uridylyltransferase [Nitrospirota bacterium]|mgnify:FL=1
MPELRKDPIIGRWVIISTGRGKRPTNFTHKREDILKGGFCPFCPGNEDKTPPEVLSYRNDGSKPNTPNWSVRVVPNKFPALQIEGYLHREGVGIFDKMSGIGAHEVIIESPEHTESLATLPIKQVENVLWAFRDRMMDLKKDTRFRYILIFKNQGFEAGATLEHPHSQLIALPIIPSLVAEEMKGAKEYYEYKERCIFCDIVRQETTDRSRVVAENNEFVTLSPYAPRFPFETWILPKIHDSSFEDIQKQNMENLARILSESLKRMSRVLNDPPYNFIIHNSPLKDGKSTYEDYYHWHIEIMPKLTHVAGFEAGSGFYINPTPPEEAARYLKEAEI